MKLAFTELHDIVKKYNNVLPLYTDVPRSIESFNIPAGNILLFTSIGDYAYFNDYVAAFDRCLEYYNRTGKLLNFYIIITQQHIPADLAEKYKTILKFYRIPSFYAWYHHKLDYKNFVKHKQIDKTFLSLNNRAMWYRQALFYLFVKHNLLDRSIISYHAADRFDEGNQFDFCHNQIPDICGILDQDIQQIKTMVPYKIANDPIGLIGTWDFSHAYFYNTTFCSIVTETYTESNDPFLTEKIFKPIAFSQPFLLYGSNQSLALLKEIGFETFSEIFDESYDQEPDPALRLNKLFEEVLRISTWPTADCDHALDKVAGVLEHNVNHFINILPSLYRRDIDDLRMEIESLIVEKQKLFG